MSLKMPASGQAAQTSAQNVKRAPRSLREKVLLHKTNTAQASSEPVVRVDNGKPSFTPVAPPRKKSGSPPGSHNHKKEQSSDGSESDSSACQPNSALTRVREWDCEEIPPRPINSEEEYDTDSSYCGRSGKGERQSMLALPSKSGRGAGVMMDMATKLANEMWQKGKEAIEQAGNIKKEHRATAIECLQTLYVTALALSDSRSRHKFNLERTSRRHAQEIIRSERAHKKEIQDFTSRLTSAIENQNKKSDDTLQQIKSMDNWLRFETREPHENVGKICDRVNNIEKKLDSLLAKSQTPAGPPTESNTNLLLAKLDSLHNTIDTLRRDIQNSLKHIEQSLKQASSDENISTTTREMVGKVLEQMESSVSIADTELLSETKTVKETLQHITHLLVEGANEGQQSISQPELVIKELQPICETLEAVRSELKTIREDKRVPLSPPPVSELAAVAAHPPTNTKQTRGSTTYATMVGKPGLAPWLVPAGRPYTGLLPPHKWPREYCCCCCWGCRRTSGRVSTAAAAAAAGAGAVAGAGRSALPRPAAAAQVAA
ncbi:hypothetical protein ACJJTC_018607 [Scirpophaga incertulas]